jgi:CRISPR-associated protein Cas1
LGTSAHVVRIFRDSVTVPLAFAAVKERNSRGTQNTPLERLVRRQAGRRFRQEKLVSQMIDRIKELFDANDRGGDERSP